MPLPHDQEIDFDLNDPNFVRDAYIDGVDAALRDGKYKGYHTEPPCPYPPGTKEHYSWYLAFKDAEAEGN